MKAVRKMTKTTRRGYVPEDETQFAGKQLDKLRKAAEETEYLLNRGYQAKAVTVFIGNHYLFSERQRMALVRSVSSRNNVENRLKKQITGCTKGMTVHIDGFNTIITR